MKTTTLMSRMLLAVLPAWLALGCAGQPAEPNTATTTQPVAAAGDSAVCGCETITLPIDGDTGAVASEAREVLERAVTCAGQPRVTAVRIAGHTATTGSQEYNVALGQRYADTVARALETGGVDPARIEARSFGEERPVCQELTSVCHDRNGRVEVELECGAP